jgi:hypothetical protein
VGGWGQGGSRGWGGGMCALIQPILCMQRGCSNQGAHRHMTAASLLLFAVPAWP